MNDDEDDAPTMNWWQYAWSDLRLAFSRLPFDECVRRQEANYRVYLRSREQKRAMRVGDLATEQPEQANDRLLRQSQQQQAGVENPHAEV